MSTSEYNDLFLKCQDTGKYHVFTFDMVGSSKFRAEGKYNERLAVQIKLMELNMLVYRLIQKKELEENKKILVFEDGFVHYPYPETDPTWISNGFGYKMEPFLFGDLIGFTAYRDTITKEEVMDIFEKSKKLLNIDFKFHIADGYYETNDWVEGHDKYFRGYCIDLLSNLHKDYNKKVRKQLQKQKRI